MRVLFRFFFCIFFFFFSFDTIQAQEQWYSFFSINGTVIDASDSIPLSYTHVYLINKSKFQVADSEGKFSFTLKNGDTLVFSNVGYTTRFIIFRESLQEDSTPYKIKLSKNTVTLQNVTIYGKNVLEGFFQQNRIRYNDYEVKSPEDKILYYNPSFDVSGSGFAIGGVISLLASQFNSEYKQLKKLNAIRQKERLVYEEEYAKEYLKYLIRKRLHTDVVLQNTSFLRGEVPAFLEFCSPTTEFLEYASDYEIIRMLKIKESLYIDKVKLESGSSDDAITTMELRRLLKD
ncbi:MAG: carboxypeptidase-like regulatory domain-containing protein [Chitinophagaceae bacterium]|nr:carboxypeptidase-like regulatory domain-containing protein [Chitinophagaceae bacterium]